jgi:hypothetical protein
MIWVFCPRRTFATINDQPGIERSTGRQVLNLAAALFITGVGGETMTYRVLYGHPAGVTRRDAHLDERVRSERFSTEHEALNRARELVERQPDVAVAVRDEAGNQLSGLRLHLKLGLLCQ